MKHIVLAWEMGGGFGHLNRLRALAEQLLAYGYRITLVTAHKLRAETAFSDLDVALIQSPCANYVDSPLGQTPAYVHVLFNAGYGDQQTLTTLVKSWYQLLQQLNPDMLIADHAPTALLVSRYLNVIRVNYGDGFTCPQPSTPLPLLSKTAVREQVVKDELTMVEYCNNALLHTGLAPIQSLSEIYQVDETFMLTVPELDHLGSRLQVTYCGGLLTDYSLLEPVWPEVPGWPKVFVYLQAFEQLTEILDRLSQSPVNAVIYVEGLSPSLQSNYQEYSHIRFYDVPLNISKVLEGADLIISHGGHQMSLQAALFAVPQLHIPLTLEQQLLAYRCSRYGSSIYGFPFEFNNKLHEVLDTLALKKTCATDLAERVAAYAHNPLGRCVALINYHLRARFKPAQTIWGETEIYPEYRLPAEEL